MVKDLRRVKKNCEENHLVNLFVFEHLDFGVKNGIEIKLVCLNMHVILCIFKTFIAFDHFCVI
jgi:hypothetical protein